MRVISIMAKNMELDLSNGAMDPLTLANFMTIICMEKEYILGVTFGGMKANGN